MITFNLRARTKQYARGSESPSDAMTSAIHIVADRETPTRQWTSVAVEADLPRALPSVSPHF